MNPGNIKSYSIESIPPTKRKALWAHSAERNGIYPVCYFQKPKWMSDEDFEKVLEYIRWDAPVGVFGGDNAD